MLFCFCFQSTIFLSETGSCYVAQADLELRILDVTSFMGLGMVSKSSGTATVFFFFFPNILGFLNPALSLSKQNYALFSFICESVSGIFRVLTHFAWTQPGCGALAHYKCDTVTGQRCVRCVTWCYFEKVQRFLASAEGEHQNTFNSVLFNGKGNLKNGTAGTVCGA